MTAKLTIALLAALAGVLASGPAAAHGGYRSHHWSGPRIFIGPSIGWWYYPPPVRYYPYDPYYAPPVAVVPRSPPVYIERGDSAGAAPQQQDYWHYCPESKTYYPYVKECPGGWERVVPRPPSN